MGSCPEYPKVRGYGVTSSGSWLPGRSIPLVWVVKDVHGVRWVVS
jgi:hypothetical protein